MTARIAEVDLASAQALADDLRAAFPGVDVRADGSNVVAETSDARNQDILRAYANGWLDHAQRN